MTRKIDEVADGIDAVSGVLSIINPVFSAIPLITYGIRRVFGLISNRDIANRINKIENQLKNNKITIDEFKEKIATMDEHKRYFASNSLNDIILKAIPETVDIYIKLFIEYIMDINCNEKEELCEIVSNLNSNDIKTLKMIKTFLLTGEKDEFNKRVIKREREKIEREKERKEIQEYNANENNKIKKLDFDFFDRSLILENITIFWKDFCSFCEYPIVPLNYYSLGQVGLKSKKYDGKSLALSLQKIERLGLIQVDYLATLATISSQNIDRFHLNEIGRKLIEYIDA